MGANLSYSNLSGADLSGQTKLIETIITGINAWEIVTDENTVQKNLVIEQWIDPLEEFVDDSNAGIDNIDLHINNLEVAHLLYL